MPVTVDSQPLRADALGFETLGQVLTHLQGKKRLVVQLLIDGCEPDLSSLAELRRKGVKDHHIFIETADPGAVALDAMEAVEEQLDQADAAKTEAAEFLQQDQTAKAMEKLSRCLSIWQAAQRSVLEIGQLLQIDLDKITVGALTLEELSHEFAAQLRQIKTSLQNRDFVTLSDLLIYETTETTSKWRQALAALRTKID